MEPRDAKHSTQARTQEQLLDPSWGKRVAGACRATSHASVRAPWSPLRVARLTTRLADSGLVPDDPSDRTRASPPWSIGSTCPHGHIRRGFHRGGSRAHSCLRIYYSGCSTSTRQNSLGLVEASSQTSTPQAEHAASVHSSVVVLSSVQNKECGGAQLNLR